MSEEIRRVVPPHLYANHFSNIVFKTSFGNCVYKALCKRKWKQYESGQWNLQWCQKERINDVFQQGISQNQRVNHFRLYTQLCRKDMLMKNVRMHKRQLQKKNQINQIQWDFLPSTYFLPSQYIMFSQDFKKRSGLWILKPTGRCQGSGIFLVNRLAQVAPYRVKASQNQNTDNLTSNSSKQTKKKLEKHIEEQQSNQNSQQQSSKQKQKQTGQTQQQIQPNQTFIIQKYIDNPLLFGRKKFDMRIYVLCTDYRNLTVWLYRSGFARFTHQPYNPEDIQNLGGHLTNVAIQQTCPNYDPVRGGKWLLKQFKHFLFSRYPKQVVDRSFNDIKGIILKSIQSVQKKILPSKSSFQLYGYDIMLDSNLRPWLIQVNGGPSMTANTEFDCRLKCGLIDDVLSIVDLQGILSGNQMTVGGFDLIMYKDIPVIQHTYSCCLGGKNERIKVMKNICSKFMQRKKKEQKYKEQLKKKQKQEQKKIQEKKSQKKQKLLPNFYYQRQKQQINQNAISELKIILQYLQKQNLNANFVSMRQIGTH